MSARDGVAAIGDFFGPALSNVWDEVVSSLDDRAEWPTVDDLQTMSDKVLEIYPVEWLGMLLAAAVEVKVKACDRLVEFSQTQHPVCPFILDSSTQSHPLPAESREVDPAVRDLRRARRVQRGLKRQQVRDQREQSKKVARDFGSKGRITESLSETPSLEVTQQSADPEINASRLAHPRLPIQATNRVDVPVGLIGSAYIYWGPLADQGKLRPVLIVGSSASHLWVRPIFTNDFKAGLWRAVEVADWRRAGLDHASYISIDVLRIKRTRCNVGSRGLTDADWNRVCRGEVH